MTKKRKTIAKKSKKTKEVSINLNTLNFINCGIDYTYDTDYSYNNHFNDCSCDGIYRCTKIDNLRVTEIESEYLAEVLTKNLKRNNEQIFKFCLERICNTLELNDFEVFKGKGYYGEEVKSIELTNYKAKEMLEKFFKLTKERDMVEYFLIQEYGYVLDSLKKKNWGLVSVPINKIFVPNQYRKLNRKTIEKYMARRQFSCLCEAEDIVPTGQYTGYKLRDGYHRYTAAKEKKAKQITVLKPK